MKENLSRALTAVLVACALVVTGLVVRQEFFGTDSPVETRFVEDWQAVAAGGHVQGPAEAPVKIVEFFDYECPYCREVSTALEEIRRRYPEEVAVVYRHFPLPIHAQAVPAAVAAECAAEQGRFARYHDLLFANQDRLGAAPWDSLAQTAGVADIEAFQGCVEEERTEERVRADWQAARELGINAIPTFVVNGRLISGALPADVLDRLVQDALDE